jgi:hypothetical protein
VCLVPPLLLCSVPPLLAVYLCSVPPLLLLVSVLLLVLIL